MFSRIEIFRIVVLLFFSVNSFAHEKHHHGSHANEIKANNSSAKEKQILEQINTTYQKEIKPIFQSKCMNCHSTQTEYPFYYNWPLAKKLIDEDIAESKKHLDMTNGFPFVGHGTPEEDLEAIKKEVSNGEMPPFRYRIMHWGSALANTDKKIISDWVDESLKVLRSRDKIQNK